MWHAAILAAQLPDGSRVRRAFAPFSENSTATQLLRAIEYNQRLWAWGNTDEAKDKTTAPDPIPLPGEAESREMAVEHTRAEAFDVAAALGVDI